MVNVEFWTCPVFGGNSPVAPPEHRFELLSQKIPGGRGGFNHWTINGKSWPDTDPLIVEQGKRYRGMIATFDES
jgi:hypothetical protein